jgi:hypothetical protein
MIFGLRYDAADAIIAFGLLLIVVTKLLILWRSEVRFGRLDRDIQDAIKVQYAILRETSDQQARLDAHETRIDALRADLEERCAKMDKRVVTLERPAKSA